MKYDQIATSEQAPYNVASAQSEGFACGAMCRRNPLKGSAIMASEKNQ
jgi:hypothetical protein